MGYFLTEKARIEQTDNPRYWKTLDNILYQDNEGTIYLVPRYFWSDGYSFPRILLSIFGNAYDVRPSYMHDLFCRFHECIKVTLSIEQLKSLGYLRVHEDKIVCENIPNCFLEILPITKWDCDCIFKRCMLSCNISERLAETIRFGVLFNFNWINTGKKSLLEFMLYKQDIGLINGY